MSWTDRLKKAVDRTSDDGSPNVAADGTELRLPPVDRVDPLKLSREEVIGTLVQDLVRINEGKLEESDLDPKGHLFDFGYVDSLSAVIFLARIEERFGTQIEDIDLVESCSDLDSIVDRIREHA